jgi:hypothetical protein
MEEKKIYSSSDLANTFNVQRITVQATGRRKERGGKRRKQ